MKCAVAVALVLYSASCAAAADFTGLDLQYLCNSHDDKAVSMCEMWIGGFMRGLSAAQAISKQQRVTCLPNGSTGEQGVLIVQKFLKDSPQLLHQPADVLAFVALTRAFPCGRGNSN
jgi:hypothetical protein